MESRPPNTNILNIISKARQEPYKAMIPDMFETDEKTLFKHDASVKYSFSHHSRTGWND